MPTDDDLTKLSALELVKLYGAWNHDAGTVRADGGGALYRQRIAGANDLLAEIERRLEQQPVQARDNHDDALWIHACGTVWPILHRPAEHEHACCDRPGPWRPLLVAADSPPPAADPAPGAKTPVFPRHLLMAGGAARCGETHPTHTTRVGASVQCPNCLGAMQAEIDELTPEDIRGYREAIGAKPVEPDTLAQVMEALGVDRPEDVLPDVLKLKAAFERVCESADLRARQRDEARAGWERNRKLADDIAAALGVDETGDLLAEVYRLKAAQPDPLVLRLPEVPEGTVALTGVKSGARYPLATGGYMTDHTATGPVALGEVLDGEPEGVRVELAPPPATEPRTAAQVWAGLPAGTGESLREWDENLAELAEALDREMGRTS